MISSLLSRKCFVNVGTRCMCSFQTQLQSLRRNDVKVDIPDAVRPVLSLETANAAQVLKYKQAEARKLVRLHATDTGSAASQIASITEKINNMVRHFATHKSDLHSHRGFQAMVHNRRTLMRYLRRTNFPLYEITIVTFGLQKEAKQLKGGKGDKRNQVQYK